MNIPYRKQFSETEELLNPIQNGFYPGKTFLGFAKDEKGNPDENKPMFYPNRAERRSKPKLGNNRASTSKRCNSRLQFRQVIPAFTGTKIVEDEQGNLVKKEINHPKKIIIHTKNPN